MTNLELLGVASGIASIASLAFAGFIYHRSSMRKTREEGNVNVLRERLKGISNNLSATTSYLQYIIRHADDESVPVRELQNMARGVRTGLLSSIADAESIVIAMDKWQVGKLLESRPLDHRWQEPNEVGIDEIDRKV